MGTGVALAGTGIGIETFGGCVSGNDFLPEIGFYVKLGNLFYIV